MVCEKVHSIRFEPYCFLTPSLLEEQVCALHNTSGTVYNCMCVWSSLMDHIKPQVGYNACLLGLNPEVCLLWYRDEPLVKGPSITDTSHIKIVVLLEWANPPTNHGVCVCVLLTLPTENCFLDPLPAMGSHYLLQCCQFSILMTVT